MILVCGEALVDLFVQNQGPDVIKTDAVLGGSPFNVAIALSRLGQAVGFYGGISSDQFGNLLVARLRASEVDLSHLVRSDRLTTISVVATDESGTPSYSFHGEDKADRFVEIDDLPARLPESVHAITFGSYTIAVQPVCDTLLALAKREAGTRTISIDPNVRPNVTPEMSEWRDRFEAFLPFANVVKASEEDLTIAYGDRNVDELVSHWHDAGPSLVVVTHGANGATGYLRGCPPTFVPGRKVEVIDTVGAGDTFHAALLAHLATSDRLTLRRFLEISPTDLEAAMRYAVVASSITCTRQGAAVPTADEVAHVIKSMRDSWQRPAP